jgi:hypothetical protein
VTWPQEIALLQVIRNRVGVDAPNPDRGWSPAAMPILQ